MTELFFYPIPIFDARVGTTIKFEIRAIPEPLPMSDDAGVTEPVETVMNVNIYDATTGRVINKVIGVVRLYWETFMQEVIPCELDFEAGWVSNRAGGYYIKFEVEGEEWGNSGYFFCREKPNLYFPSFPADEETIVRTSTVRFYLKYDYLQEQRETLSTYQFYFYDEQMRLLSQSKTFYGEPSEYYQVDSLSSGATYYIRATGETKNGYQLDTGAIHFSVFFGDTESRTLLKATSNPRTGNVTLEAHIVSIDGMPDGEYAFFDIGDGNYVVNLMEGSALYSIPIELPVYRAEKFCLRAVVVPELYKDIIVGYTDDGDSFRILLTKRAFTTDPTGTEYVYAVLISQHITVLSNKIVEHGYEGPYLFDVLFENGKYLLNISEVEVQ